MAVAGSSALGAVVAVTAGDASVAEKATAADSSAGDRGARDGPVVTAGTARTI